MPDNGSLQYFKGVGRLIMKKSELRRIIREEVSKSLFKVGDTVIWKREGTAGKLLAIGVIEQIKGDKAYVIKETGIHPRKDWVRLSDLSIHKRDPEKWG